ncbi:uncharacterized protein [Watersipora subatra]|uniref:uncharacterized protein isoform X3 n=1 Tax=Watersipora subatra TaxID=2589382 RepID=UPI00355C5B28
MALKRLYLLFLFHSQLQYDSFALLQVKIIWKCSGKQSEYTYFDCQTDRSLTDGCYYLIHFAQYRPCNDVCDGVKVGSRDEERCHADCPEYLNNYCETKSLEALAATQPAPSSSMSRVNPEISSATQMNASDRVQLVVLATLIFIACLLLFLTIGSVVLCLQCKKKRSRLQAQNNAKLPTNKTVAHEELGETCSLSLQLSTDYPVQAIGDLDHNMKNEKLENECEVMIVD